MPPRPRSRLLLFWGLFALAAVATGLAIHRLYQTAQLEISAQNERALQQERTRLLQRIQTYTEDVRRSIITELASFHVDGLGPSLRQWDEANEIITGTFRWDPVHGFSEDTSLPSTGPKRELLPPLWQSFWEWQTSHPGVPFRNTSTDGTRAWRFLTYHTLDNAAFPAGDLGYQSENLDILTHGGRRADPWSGWAADPARPGQPWIFWYQAGPDEPVRGCIVDVRPLVHQLRSEITDATYTKSNIADVPNALQSTPLPGLPAHWLVVEPGNIFNQKESRTRFTALIAAFLVGLFLAGAAALTLHSRRASREAERKITFVTQVSHELRTPLTSIRLFADMLGEPGLPEAKRVKFAGTIGAESGRLGALIERLLAFNALEKTAPKISRTPLDVVAVARATAEDMEATLRASGLRTELDLPAGSMTALGDPSTLKQALLNLLDNATKYAREGGLVRISLFSDPDSVRLQVADHGPGVPAVIRDQVFEPFVQGGQTLTTKSPGVGLGLSLARGMLRQAGGDLVLLDSPRGAVFEIRLPRAK